jgi:TRAP-type C4-dicarboxylate transport system permease large subunit
MMTDYAPPPKGWLYGFLLAISAFWFSGFTWEAFRNHEIGAVRFTGGVILLISGALIAYEALTDDNYKTAKATLIARRLLLPLALALIIIGGFYH